MKNYNNNSENKEKPIALKKEKAFMDKNFPVSKMQKMKKSFYK